MEKNTGTTDFKLGLALSGGGARGFAHLGAFKAIESLGLTPGLISGTSAGALAGVLYADGYTSEEIVELFVGKEFRKFAEWQMPTMAIFRMAGFRKFLTNNLRAKNFEELRIPVKVVATNLDDGISTVFDKGPIIEPVMASCSIPIIFNPVVIDGINYVDGGLFKNFPVSVIRGKCDKIIGVNVSPLVSKKYSKSIMHIAERSYHYMFRANTLEDRKLCDVLIELKSVADFKTFDLSHMHDIFKNGYDESVKQLEEAMLNKIIQAPLPIEQKTKDVSSGPAEHNHL